MLAVRPPGGFKGFVQPAGLVQVTIDPTTGQLATPSCPYQVTELMPELVAPTEACRRHSAAGEPGEMEATLDDGIAGGPDGTAGFTAGSPRPTAWPTPPWSTPALAPDPPESNGQPGSILIRPR